MTDRELLEMAAKAAGLHINTAMQAERDAILGPEKAGLWITFRSTAWNPLSDDGDALRLAQRLAIQINPSNRTDYGQTAGNQTVFRDGMTAMQTLRLAIVRAAAAMAERSET